MKHQHNVIDNLEARLANNNADLISVLQENITSPEESREDDMTLKITDSSFAKRPPLEDSLRMFCCTPGFVSPEILRRDPYGTKTDMWSIGAGAYSCHTKITPRNYDRYIDSLVVKLISCCVWTRLCSLSP